MAELDETVSLVTKEVEKFRVHYANRGLEVTRVSATEDSEYGGPAILIGLRHSRVVGERVLDYPLTTDGGSPEGSSDAALSIAITLMELTAYGPPHDLPYARWTDNG